MAATSMMTRAFQVRPAVRSFTSSRCRGTVINNIRQSHLPITAISRSVLTTRYMSQTASLTDEQRTDLEAKIKAKGDEIRSLKENGISKADLAPYVDELKALKSQLEPTEVSEPKQADKSTAKNEDKKIEEESDYITSRSENYSKWYNDIIRVCDLAEVSPVRGCMVIVSLYV
jgi:uncharacterized coiled-coil DUF342 family protein